MVQATLAIAAAIIAEASLSFLGLGQQPPAPCWGSMLNTAQRFLDQAPWMAIWPGLAIFLVVLSFNLLGDGLRDALDPRERALNYDLPHHATAIHLVFEIDHRRPRKMPGQPGGTAPRRTNSSART